MNIMTVKEHILNEINHLDDKQLYEIEKYIKFLKFNSRFSYYSKYNEEDLARLYGEYAEEDREFAEEGMEDYMTNLKKEDKNRSRLKQKLGKVSADISSGSRK